MINTVLHGIKASLLGVCIIGLAACSPSDDAEEATEETPAAETEGSAAAESATEVASSSASGIMGTVTFDGTPPKRIPIPTTSDQKCHGGEPVLSESEVVNEAGQVQNVFLYIENPPDGDYSPPSEPFYLDQVGCAYTPHVFGLQSGQEMFVKNSDPTLHNVRSMSRTNRGFNMGMPEGSDPRKVKRTLKKEEHHIRMKCDVHPWMTGYMFVMDHPFFSVSDENGAFEITGLPAGTYTLIAWHESWDEQEIEITVEDGKPLTADFTFSK